MRLNGFMQLGIYTFGDVVSGDDAATTLRHVLERVRLAEQVGLDYVGIGEHHRPEFAITSPATVVAAALARTERIHVGSAVTVLSTEDPVRVYQQFATMDALSGGRAELLAGLRLLPLGQLFREGRDVYPEMLAAWASPQSSA